MLAFLATAIRLWGSLLKVFWGMGFQLLKFQCRYIGLKAAVRAWGPSIAGKISMWQNKVLRRAARRVHLASRPLWSGRPGADLSARLSPGPKSRARVAAQQSERIDHRSTSIASGKWKARKRARVRLFDWPDRWSHIRCWSVQSFWSPAESIPLAKTGQPGNSRRRGLEASPIACQGAATTYLLRGRLSDVTAKFSDRRVCWRSVEKGLSLLYMFKCLLNNQ